MPDSSTTGFFYFSRDKGRYGAKRIYLAAAQRSSRLMADTTQRAIELTVCQHHRCAQIGSDFQTLRNGKSVRLR
jgi:hypothetical protein